MKQKEHQLQVNCVNWFRMQYPKLTLLLRAIPNGGNRDVATGAILKAEGVLKGTADLILFRASKGYHSLHIEMKIKKGVQSPEQKEYESLITKEGHKYVVCRSLGHFMFEINTYLK